MNKKCVAVRKQVHKSNGPAQQIHGTLRPYSVNFKDGGFWARLISMFHAYYDKHRKFDFKIIENMEVHEDYRLEQYLNLHVSVSEVASCLQVTLHYGCHPVFERAHYINGYCFYGHCYLPGSPKESGTGGIDAVACDQSQRRGNGAVLCVAAAEDCEGVCCLREAGGDRGWEDRAGVSDEGDADREGGRGGEEALKPILFR